jgi:hypothetical protein
MEIEIKPDIDIIRSEANDGRDEYDEDDDLAFEQGCDIDVIEVDEGETFDIPNGYVGTTDEGQHLGPGRYVVENGMAVPY